MGLIKPLNIINKVISLIELLIGVFLPWKLRCRYSAFLMKLDGKPPANYIFEEEKEREFEKLFQLGFVYAQEKKNDLAIENLNKALEIDVSNQKIADCYLFLSKCYKAKGDLDKYA